MQLFPDEYNPYCSKWGYCRPSDMFGSEGPGQSKGAVEDGSRGQCRDDGDCTPWAPHCSPIGYCRGGSWDGSFGSPTNPKPGGKQSDWIKKNAKSGAARNEEYYAKIEDDNRRAHVKFRKENPKLYEQMPELLPRLEAIEKAVYDPCTYCKYDPNADGANSKSPKRRGSKGQQKKGSGKWRGNGQQRNGLNRRNGTKSFGGQGQKLFKRRKGNGQHNNGSRKRSQGKHRTKSLSTRRVSPPNGKRWKHQMKDEHSRNSRGRKNGMGSSNAIHKCGYKCIDACPSNLKAYMSCAIDCGKRCAKAQ